MAALTINQRRVNQVTILDLTGPVTAGDNSSQFHRIMRDVCGQANANVLFNLGGVTIMDDTGIGVLAAATTMALVSNARMKLLNVQKPVMDKLVNFGLASHFPAFDNEQAAIESFA